MRLAIVGSREITDPQILLDALAKIQSLGLVTEIVSGGAKGIDTLARNYAEVNGLKLVEFLPDYEKYGRGATLARNTEIIKYADIVLAIPLKGKSKGTYDDIRKAESIGKRLYVHEVKESVSKSSSTAKPQIRVQMTENTFKVGDSVSHDRFGTGSVKDVDGLKLSVDFGETGAKVIMCTYKGLSKLE